MADDSLFYPNVAQIPEMPEENVRMLQQITSNPAFAQLIEQKVFDPFKTRVQGKDQARLPAGGQISGTNDAGISGTWSEEDQRRLNLQHRQRLNGGG